VSRDPASDGLAELLVRKYETVVWVSVSRNGKVVQAGEKRRNAFGYLGFMRVVSLLASGTEIVCALGAGEMLVGRSHECDNPEWVVRLPKCSEPSFDVSGSSAEIDREVKRRFHAGEPMYVIHDELIRELAPDVIIAQEHCEVCAVTPGSVEPGVAEIVSLNAGSLDDIWNGMLLIAHALKMEDCGQALVRSERARLDAVRARVAGLARRRVMVIEWTDPLYTIANWAPSLVDAAGGELCSVDGDPEVVIVAPCGFDLERTMRERATLDAQPWWRSLRGRAAFADGNKFFNRSGMTVTETAEIIAEILHGVTFVECTEGVHWCWVRQ
jgi:iron complex transport system substrate-binding protein